MRLIITFVWIVLGSVVLFKVDQQLSEAKQLERGQYQHLQYGNFEEFSRHMLNISQVLASFDVTDYIDCAFKCLVSLACFSLNFAILADNSTGRHVCHLLSSDKYHHSSSFVPSDEFHHYAIASPCESFPCQNGGTCRPLYDKDSYVCNCHEGHNGTHCEKGCNETLTGVKGAFHSPNYPNKYPGGQYCSWRITVSPTQQILLTFANFSFQSENNTDGLYVYDGENTTGEVLGVFYGGCPPAKEGIYSSSNHMFVIFKSDSNDSYTSFNASYNAVNSSVYKSCSELYKAGKRTSGAYKINPDNGGAFDVYCDQTTDGGGWTVFQKRLDGSVDFYRGWDNYTRGFGNLSGEFWLGLDKIHRLTKSPNKLRVDLEDFSGNTTYAEYSSFGVGDEGSKYKLSLGSYSGTAGDSLSSHRGMPFTTKDRDNDNSNVNCATRYKGAWWYNACFNSNLNGRYLKGRHSSYADGVNWYHWKGYHYSVKRAEMKVKPVNA